MHAVKGLAKAHNFLLGFFKKSGETTIKVAKQDSDTDSDDDDTSFRTRAKQEGSSVRGALGSASSGLLSYSVHDGDDGAVPGSGRSSSGSQPSASTLRRGQLNQPSMSRLSSRALRPDDSGEEAHSHAPPLGGNTPCHLPDIALSGAGSMRKSSLKTLPSMCGNARFKDSVCMFAPSQLPAEGRGRGSLDEEAPGNPALARLSGNTSLSGRRSPSHSLDPLPPPEGLGGTASGRFSRMAGRSFSMARASSGQSAADADDETRGSGRDEGRAQEAPPSPIASSLPAHLRQGYASQPAESRSGRSLASNVSFAARSSAAPEPAGLRPEDGEELEEALMNGSASGWNARTRLTRGSGSRRDLSGGAVSLLPLGLEDSFTRSASSSSALARLPSTGGSRTTQLLPSGLERHASSPIPVLPAGKDDASSGGASPTACRSGSLSLGPGSNRPSLDETEGGGQRAMGALDMLHKVQSSTDAGAASPGCSFEGHCAYCGVIPY